MTDATDGDLVRRARGGEAAAFAELCRRHGSRARTLARRVLGADAEVEDVVQDALLAAFAGLARLREPERFAGRLYAIAVNLARMRVRARHPDGALRRRARPAPPGARATAIRARVPATQGGPGNGGDGDREGARASGRRDAARDEALRVVLLRERDGDRRLPIWIGRPDGDALAVRLAEQQTPRPLTVDLTAGLLAAAGVQIQRVTVNRLAERTFYAVVSLANAGDVDARPRDALNLALRVGAPVHVAEEVLAEAATVADDIAAELDEREQALGYAGGEPWRELESGEVVAAWDAAAEIGPWQIVP